MLAKIQTLLVLLFLSFSLPIYANEHNNTVHNLETNATLTRTYWRLISLSNHTMSLEKMRREAHIIFSDIVDGKGRLKGASGCNDMLGKYVRDEQNISIDTKHIAMTRMACPENNVEIAFLKAMEGTVKWQITNHHLEFMDINSSVLAEFTAKKLK